MSWLTCWQRVGLGLYGPAGNLYFPSVGDFSTPGSQQVKRGRAHQGLHEEDEGEDAPQRQHHLVSGGGTVDLQGRAAGLARPHIRLHE